MKRLIAQLQARLAHNDTYLSNTPVARQMSAELSHSRLKSLYWIEGEEAAIRAENQWIRALLADFSPKEKAS